MLDMKIGVHLPVIKCAFLNISGEVWVQDLKSRDLGFNLISDHLILSLQNYAPANVNPLPLPKPG